MWRGKRLALRDGQRARLRMRQPISFAYRNLVFGRDASDAWAMFRLSTRPYAGLTRQGKQELLAALAGLAYTLEADFQLLRVTRPWSVDSYLHGCQAQADSRHANPLFGDYLEGHRSALDGRAIERPEVFLAARLVAQDRDPASAGPATWLAKLGRAARPR